MDTCTTMTSSTEPLSEKEAMILDCALDLLKNAGDAGLTMRKLAERAGMRLSNVQYYFKSRDDVLKAMATRYFEECAQEITQLTQYHSGLPLRERAHLLILTGLRHGDELSDMCRIFRELWAISSRNETIRDHMADYYQTFSSLIAGFVLGDTAPSEIRARVASLLLPFIEGYSVTAASTPLPTERVADLLTELTLSVASPSGKKSG